MNESVRIVSAWLSDAQYGVDAVAAAVPRDAGDPAPGAVTVVDETDTPWVALGQAPAGIGAGQTAVAVSLDGDLTFELPPRRAAEGALVHSTECDIVIELIARRSQTPAAAAEMNTLARAVHGSLLLLFDAGQSAYAARRRNGVELSRLATVRHVRAERPLGDSLLAQALVARIALDVLVPFHVA